MPKREKEIEVTSIIHNSLHSRIELAKWCLLFLRRSMAALAAAANNSCTPSFFSAEASTKESARMRLAVARVCSLEGNPRYRTFRFVIRVKKTSLTT